MSELQGMKRINQSISRAMDLPKEFALDLPKVEMLGNFQVYIENHQGIHQYHEQQMIINCRIGQLIISGEDLIIRQITLDDLYIEGKIQSVTFNENSLGKDGA